VPKSPSSPEFLPYRQRPRRRYDLSFKQSLVRQTYETHASLATIASEHGINANLLWRWRSQYEAGELGLISQQPVLLPVEVKQDSCTLKPDSHASQSATLLESCIEIYIGHAKLVLRGNPETSLLRKAIEALR
jgi:transposase